MSASAAPAEPTPPANPAASDDAYLQHTIKALIDAGAQLVRDLVAEQAPASAKAEPYERLARALRRSILLARHLAEHPVRTQAARRAQARKQIIRAVEDSIGREAGDAAETLRAELYERLDAPDLEDDITNRPIEVVIAEICRDLGLGDPLGLPPYTRRTPAALQALAALAAAPPAAALPPTPPDLDPAELDEDDPAEPDEDDDSAELDEDEYEADGDEENDDEPGDHARPPDRPKRALSSPNLLATLLAERNLRIPDG